MASIQLHYEDYVVPLMMHVLYMTALTISLVLRDYIGANHVCLPSLTHCMPNSKR